MFVPCEMLLHPELLTNEQLTYIIKEVCSPVNVLLLYQNKKKQAYLFCLYFQRHLRIPNIDGMKRDELLDIFHHYCVPYGQRKYRDSGRGRILNRTRPTSPEPARKLNTIVENGRKHTNPNCDRLKPAPDLLSGHMKRIKLETTVTPVKIHDYLNNIKRKMSVDSVSIFLSCH